MAERERERARDASLDVRHTRKAMRHTTRRGGGGRTHAGTPSAHACMRSTEAEEAKAVGLAVRAKQRQANKGPKGKITTVTFSHQFPIPDASSRLQEFRNSEFRVLRNFHGSPTLLSLSLSLCLSTLDLSQVFLELTRGLDFFLTK